MNTRPPVTVHAMDGASAHALSVAFSALFSSWDRPISVFTRYLAEQDSGSRICMVGQLGDDSVGFVTLRLESLYLPFAAQGIPEISDLNVLPDARRKGVGNALMAAAESTAMRSGATTVGLGVGLYPDYGAAQRIYVRRGYLPDGRGVMYKCAPVPPGKTIKIDDDATLMFTKTLK